jgi:hypothetical protein
VTATEAVRTLIAVTSAETVAALKRAIIMMAEGAASRVKVTACSNVTDFSIAKMRNKCSVFVVFIRWTRYNPSFEVFVPDAVQ